MKIEYNKKKKAPSGSTTIYAYNESKIDLFWPDSNNDASGASSKADTTWSRLDDRQMLSLHNDKQRRTINKSSPLRHNVRWLAHVSC